MTASMYFHFLMIECEYPSSDYLSYWINFYLTSGCWLSIWTVAASTALFESVPAKKNMRTSPVISSIVFYRSSFDKFFNSSVNTRAERILFSDWSFWLRIYSYLFKTNYLVCSLIALTLFSMFLSSLKYPFSRNLVPKSMCLKLNVWTIIYSKAIDKAWLKV